MTGSDALQLAIPHRLFALEILRSYLDQLDIGDNVFEALALIEN